MRNLGYLALFVAMLLALPLSWWLVVRSRRDPGIRRIDDNRAEVDRLSAGTGFGSPPGGGP
jgi:hypothetical protein